MRTPALSRIATFSFRHRLLVLIAWILATVIAVILAANLGASPSNDFSSTATGSGRAQRLITEHFPGFSADTLTLVVHGDRPLSDPAVRDRVQRMVGTLATTPHVSRVASPYDAPDQMSADRHTGYARAALDVPADQVAVTATTRLVAAVRAASGDGVTFAIGGQAVDRAETPGGGAADGVGLAVAAIVLLLAFGSLLAMGLPILTAIFGIAMGLSGMSLIQHVVPAPSFASILATMIGLGVGIDYALFIVTRYREALSTGSAPEQAAATAVGTAGRAVLFAGGTVVVGLCGLLLLGLDFMNGVAVGSALTVLMTMLAAVTLLPALLGFVGRHIDRLAVHRRRPAEHPLSARWAAGIARRPVVAVLIAGILLAVLAAPALWMRLGTPDASTQPRDTSGYTAHRLLVDGFGAGFDATLSVVVTLPGGDPQRVSAAIAGQPGVARISPPQVSTDGAVALMAVEPTTGTQDQSTVELVRRLRSVTAGQPVYIGGAATAAMDFAQLTAQRLPLIILVVLGLSLLLLVVIFRSVTLALKAGVLNLMSIGASFGVLVAVLQWGWLHRALNFPTEMPVTAWVPMIMFPVLFGLSMDYEVFLVSRIREAYDVSGDTATAVRDGLSRTARVITAAAAIMIAVFLSVMLGADIGVKELGLGLAVAVFLDATLVRLVLVPAAMHLFGRTNWWMPRWLDRVLPTVRLEADHQPVRTDSGQPGGGSDNHRDGRVAALSRTAAE